LANRNEYQRQWYANNREKILEKVRARSKGRHKKRYADPTYKRQVKDWGVQRLYGISLEEYETRLQSQNGVCALCGELMDGLGTTGRAPVLDHDHKTKKLRAFIHQDCNVGIGKLKDDSVKLRKAADYLEKYNDEQ
jgi:hypothetical protein